MSDNQLMTAAKKPAYQISSLRQSIINHEMHEKIKNISYERHPKNVLDNAAKELAAGGVEYKFTQEAMKIHAFENGILLATILSDTYKTFAIDLSQQYQEEFECTTASSKSLCEIAAINFVRILEAESLLASFMRKPSHVIEEVQFISVLSKEIDRAHRTFTSVIQELRLSKQPQLKLNVKVKNAIINNNSESINSHE